jgi:hypothetical protein
MMEMRDIEAAFPARAADALSAVVEAGASILIQEPWRVGRIIRDAEAMTFEALCESLARRRAMAPPADFNRAIALAQLALAMKSPVFHACWVAWRRGRQGESEVGVAPPMNEDLRPMAPRAAVG